MSDTKYLVQRKGTWLFNWRVPKDCTELFNGKTLVTHSLKTKDLKEARLRRNQMLAEIETQVQAHRKGPNSRSSDSMPESFIYREAVKSLLTVSDDDLSGAYSALTYKLEKLLDGKEVSPDLKPIENQLLSMSQAERAKALKDANLSAMVDLIEDPTERANAKALQNAYLGVQHDLVHTTLKEVAKLHQEDNQDKLKVNTLRQSQKAVSLFLEFVGKEDVPLNSIGRKLVKDFIKDRLREKAGSTVKNYVIFLSAIWEHAVDIEMVEGPNPFVKHKIESAPTQSYQLFEDKELAALFAESLKYKDKPKDYYKFLVPRLGYVTGCRIEEICSLTCEQIKTDRATNITYFEVIEGKTENAKRKIPVHNWVAPELLAQRKRIGKGLLFPELETTRKDGKRSDKVSKWFRRHKEATLGYAIRSKAFHSFRVHVATALERGEVPESTAVWILGHTRNLSLSYGLYSKGMDLAKLKDAIDCIPIGEDWR